MSLRWEIRKISSEKDYKEKEPEHKIFILIRVLENIYLWLKVGDAIKKGS